MPDSRRRRWFRGSIVRQGNDLNGNGALDQGEPQATLGGIPPFMTTSGYGESLFLTDPNLSAPVTRELFLSLQRALQPDFVVGLGLTRRTTTDVLDDVPLLQGTGGSARPALYSDFISDGTIAGTTPDGTPYSVDLFALAPGRTLTGGSLLTNGDSERPRLEPRVQQAPRQPVDVARPRDLAGLGVVHAASFGSRRPGRSQPAARRALRRGDVCAAVADQERRVHQQRLVVRREWRGG